MKWDVKKFQPRLTILLPLSIMIAITVAILSIKISDTKIARDPTLFTKASHYNNSSDEPSKLFYKNVGNSPADFYGYEEMTPQNHLQFTVELAITTSQEKANRVVNELGNLGIDAFYTPLHKKGHVFFRIRSGIFKSKAEARLAAKNLQNIRGINTKIGRL